MTLPEITKNYNVLSPSTVMVQANPNFTPSVAVLKFSRQRGSLYSLDKKWDPKAKQETWTTASFGKIELLQIAKAMGLRMGVSEVKIGQGASQRDIVAKHVVLERDVDGSWMPHTGTRVWLYEVEYQRCVAQCPETKWDGDGDERAKRPLSDAEKEAWIKKNWMERQTSAEAMTDTKALLAAIRCASMVPLKFPAADLDKPWAIVRYTFSPDPNNVQIMLAQMDAGDNSARLLYSGTGPSANGSPGAKPGWVYDEDDAGETAAAGDVPAGVDPETGVIEGECLEETDDAGEPTRQTFGDKPTEDKHIPAGTHEGKMLSDVCRDDPDYARSTFLSADSVKAVTEQWLRYWHGNGPAKGDFQDVKF